MAGSVLARRRLLRFVASASVYAFSIVTLLAGLIIGLSRSSPSVPGGHKVWVMLASVAALAVIVVGCQTFSEYRRRQHDPTWILKYQDKFDQMKKDRFEAAKTLIEQKGQLGNLDGREDVLDPIDDVLDFFEDIGFYERGGQISPETAHHHFYHWLRIYWQAARPYIGAWRKDAPARWSHIDDLFETASEVEMEEAGCSRSEITLSCDRLDEFLKQEIKFCSGVEADDKSSP